jgi:tetratricopeptide (TPR) repeat protein
LELIYEKSLFPDLEYMFKHVLTQEATYHSLLGTRRKSLHTAIGLAMEALYPERLAEHYEELACHFTQGEAWEKAVWYLLKSGDKARLAYANQDAIPFYTHAIEVSGRITLALEEAQLVPVYEGRGLVRMLLADYDAAIADFQTMRQLAHASGHPQKEGESLCHLAYVHWAKLHEDETTHVGQYATEALQLVHQLGDQHILAQSLASLGLAQQARGTLSEAERRLAASIQISCRQGYHNALAQSLAFLGLQVYWQGYFPRAAQLSQEGLAVSRALHDSFDEFLTLAHVGLAHWGTGDCGQALILIDEGLKSAQERESQFHIGRFQNILGGFYHELGAVSRAIEYDQASVEVGQQYRLPPVEFSALINLGLDYCALAQHARARSCFEPALDRVRHGSFGTVASCKWRWEMRLLIGLAELSYATADYEQAVRYVEEGLKIALATSSQKYVAKGRGLRGKIAAALGDPEAAGAELQRALALAEQLQSPMLLYPMAYELGQWYEMDGQEREAAAVYRKANAVTTRMATALDDEGLRTIFLQSAAVQAIGACVARLGG